MITEIKPKNLINTISSVKISIETESKCPICKTALSPVYLASELHEINDVDYVSVFNYCSNCSSTFISRYECIDIATGQNYFNANAKLLISLPISYAPKVFEENINSLSPQFVKIYNQALQAETLELDEIAGIGYRKSIEFLVKDFAIHHNPEDIELIKSKPLGQCITVYIDAPQMQSLFKSATWIGNDETHYVKKIEDRDISDMKAFIKAAVSYVSMDLIAEDAASMDPR